MSLSDTSVRNLKSDSVPAKHAGSDGLCLYVSPYRSKKQHAHIVPLVPQVMDVLKDLPVQAG